MASFRRPRNTQQHGWKQQQQQQRQQIHAVQLEDQNIHWSQSNQIIKTNSNINLPNCTLPGRRPVSFLVCDLNPAYTAMYRQYWHRLSSPTAWWKKHLTSSSFSDQAFRKKKNHFTSIYKMEARLVTQKHTEWPSCYTSAETVGLCPSVLMEITQEESDRTRVGWLDRRQLTSSHVRQEQSNKSHLSFAKHMVCQRRDNRRSDQVRTEDK